MAEGKKVSEKEYAVCVVCKEKVGLEGRMKHGARENDGMIGV